MIVIVEGADGSGKTTLVQNLRHKYEILPYIPRGPENNFREWDRRFHTHEHTIAVTDRSFLSDLVYRIVDCEVPSITVERMCKLLREYDVKVILCETDTAFEDSMKRGEDNITDKDTAMQIKWLYSHVIKLLSVSEDFQYITYNWKEENIQKVIDFIGG